MPTDKTEIRAYYFVEPVGRPLDTGPQHIIGLLLFQSASLLPVVIIWQRILQRIKRMADEWCLRSGLRPRPGRFRLMADCGRAARRNLPGLAAGDSTGGRSTCAPGSAPGP